MRVPRDSGLTLAEVLVAMAILLIAVQAALLLYSASWDSFKKGENAAEQQQSTRIAFDKLGLDLQMAGFNYNPDGDDARPDEQIEAAFDAAIVLRGDFDAQDASLVSMPEGALAGGAFDVVSTGNDEIVAYVLGRPDGSSTDTLAFEADVKDLPRDGAVETVLIPDVALTLHDPPFTLYRITLNNDETTWGTDDFFVRTVLAENVDVLRFRYFDIAGNQLNPLVEGTIADDIGGAEAAAAVRARIYRIEVDLIGLTRDPDLQWIDPDDTTPATRSHRKFQLKGSITPRNLGKVGVEDLPAI